MNIFSIGFLSKFITVIVVGALLSGCIIDVPFIPGI